MAKPLYMMTASEIRKVADKARAACSKNCTDLINAGFGNVRGSEIRAMSHPLAIEYIRVNDFENEITMELEARKRYHGGMQRIIRNEA